MVTRKPLSERFWPKVDKTDECWIWRGGLTSNGYGSLSAGGSNGRKLLAHRVAYEFVIGPIPEGLDLDHLCRVRACVNPAHLEPVTRRENLIRGNTIIAAQVARTHCPQGHPYDEANTFLSHGGRKRQCRICTRAFANRARNARRAAARAKRMTNA
jgi:hypothetical protein